MNAERLLSMLFRMATRRVVHRGVDAAMDRMAGPKKAHKDMSPEERAFAKAQKQKMRAARRVTRL